MIEATRQSASVNGITLSYFDVGAGEPVLLLHGFPDDALIWVKQVEALVAAGYRCIVPDLRGYGDSDAPAEQSAYAVPEILADLTGLLDRLNLSKVALVGHDWGAAIGWAFVINFPKRVRRFVALAVGHPTAYVKAGWDQKRKGYYVLIFKLPLIPEWLLLRNAGAILRKIGPTHDVVMRRTASFARPGRMTAALNYYRENVRFIGQSTLPPVSVPVFGMWSDQDAALAEDQMVNSARYMAAEWRYARIEGGGHWFMLSNTAQVNTLILDYLGEQQPND